MDLFCASRIESPKHSMQIRRTHSSRPRSQTFAQLVGALWTRKQSFEESTQIKPSTTHHNRQMSTPRNVNQYDSRSPRILSGGERLIGIRDIDQVMLDPDAIFA